MNTTIRIGMIGLDTSHCPAFADVLNNPQHPFHVPGARVVAAYPGGSEQFSLSRNRVTGFTDELKTKFGVTIVDSIPELARAADAILLESVDGRQHLDQFKLAAIGKPIFIDKPLAASTADAREILRLAEQTRTPLMSCSSLRYAAGIADLLSDPGERVVSCEAFGPAALLDDYPGLFWYGIHSVEVLFSLMGRGCRQVRCLSAKDVDVALGEWADGRCGVFRGARFEKGEFGCVVHTTSGARLGVAKSTPPYYATMLRQIVEFFRTGISPIPFEETFDIIAFIEAADRSKALSGAPVPTASL